MLLRSHYVINFKLGLHNGYMQVVAISEVVVSSGLTVLQKFLVLNERRNKQDVRTRKIGFPMFFVEVTIQKVIAMSKQKVV